MTCWDHLIVIRMQTGHVTETRPDTGCTVNRGLIDAARSRLEGRKQKLDMHSDFWTRVWSDRRGSHRVTGEVIIHCYADPTYGVARGHKAEDLTIAMLPSLYRSTILKKNSSSLKGGLTITPWSYALLYHRGGSKLYERLLFWRV